MAAALPVVAVGPVEDLDNRAMIEARARDLRRNRVVPVVAGLIFVAAGLTVLLFFPTWPVGKPAVPYAFLLLGFLFLGLVAVFLRSADRIASRVRIDDVEFRLHYAGGKQVEVAWRGPQFQLILRRWVSDRPTPSWPIPGWVLLSGDTLDAVTEEIGDALARRAGRLGLKVTRSHAGPRKWRGATVSFETINISTPPPHALV